MTKLRAAVRAGHPQIADDHLAEVRRRNAGRPSLIGRMDAAGSYVTSRRCDKCSDETEGFALFVSPASASISWPDLPTTKQIGQRAIAITYEPLSTDRVVNVAEVAGIVAGAAFMPLDQGFSAATEGFEIAPTAIEPNRNSVIPRVLTLGCAASIRSTRSDSWQKRGGRFPVQSAAGRPGRHLKKRGSTR